MSHSYASYTICRHCRTRRPARPRGLCWRCYYTPGLREQYPSESKYAMRPAKGLVPQHDPLDTTEYQAPIADEPTTAEPGTLDKIEVLARRLAAGLTLHHPYDRRRQRHDLDVDSEKQGQRNQEAVV